MSWFRNLSDPWQLGWKIFGAGVFGGFVSLGLSEVISSMERNIVWKLVGEGTRAPPVGPWTEWIINNAGSIMASGLFALFGVYLIYGDVRNDQVQKRVYVVAFAIGMYNTPIILALFDLAMGQPNPGGG